MEVAFSGGAVVTNHPEFKPYVVIPPSDRGGPGPRFAATIPSLHPTVPVKAVRVNWNLISKWFTAPWRQPRLTKYDVIGYGTAIANDAGIGLGQIGPFTLADWTFTDYVLGTRPVTARLKRFGIPMGK